MICPVETKLHNELLSIKNTYLSKNFIVQKIKKIFFNLQNLLKTHIETSQIDDVMTVPILSR